MRKFMALVLVAACVCGAAFALTTPKAKNNVFAITKDGVRTALCGCTSTFTVAEGTPELEIEDMSMYCCSKECHDKMAKMPKEESTKMMVTWAAKWEESTSNLWKNVSNTAADGSLSATCTCRKPFKVSEATPIIVENGMALHYCSEACYKNTLDMKPSDRLRAALELMKGGLVIEKKAAVSPETKGE